jgi:small-conductance mechanosensitive channel
MAIFTASESALLVRTIVGLAIAAAIAAALFVFTRRLTRQSSLAEPLRRSIHLIVDGPVISGIVGLALIEVVSNSTSYLPNFITAGQITLIIQLAVLVIAIRTAGMVAKILMIHLTGLKMVDRVLVYGVYGLGLVALAYVLLTSPASPVVVSGIWQFVGFLAGLSITYLVVYVVNVVTKRYGDALTGREPQLRTVVSFVRRLALAIVALIGVAVATFSSFPGAGATVASLFVAAGFASIVIGLAAQSSLANIFAGMIVSTAQPFRIGDALSIMNEWAWVEDIRLSYTILKTWDNRRLVIPNQVFLSQSLINYDMTDSSKLCVVYVQVQYESDLDLAIGIMKKAAKEHSDFFPAGNLPVVHVMEYDQSGIQLRLLSRARDQPTNFQMSKDLLYSIRKEFISQGVKIAYPRREVVMTDGSPSKDGGTDAKGSGGKKVA